MYENLWSKDGYERLLEIDRLSFADYDAIHRVYRQCFRCPLAIRYTDVLGIQRILCVDIASVRKTLDVLRDGGKFVKRGESK